MNNVVSQNESLLFDNSEGDKRMIAIKKLINNNKIKIYEAFKKWYNHMKVCALQDQMSEQLKKHMISKMSNYFGENEKNQLKKNLGEI